MKFFSSCDLGRPLGLCPCQKEGAMRYFIDSVPCMRPPRTPGSPLGDAAALEAPIRVMNQRGRPAPVSGEALGSHGGSVSRRGAPSPCGRRTRSGWHWGQIEALIWRETHQRQPPGSWAASRPEGGGPLGLPGPGSEPVVGCESAPHAARAAVPGAASPEGPRQPGGGHSWGCTEPLLGPGSPLWTELHWPRVTKALGS